MTSLSNSVLEKNLNPLLIISPHQRTHSGKLQVGNRKISEPRNRKQTNKGDPMVLILNRLQVRRPLGNGQGTFSTWRDQVVKQQEALNIRNEKHAEITRWGQGTNGEGCK